MLQNTNTGTATLQLLGDEYLYILQNVKKGGAVQETPNEEGKKHHFSITLHNTSLVVTSAEWIMDSITSLE